MPAGQQTKRRPLALAWLLAAIVMGGGCGAPTAAARESGKSKSARKEAAPVASAESAAAQAPINAARLDTALLERLIHAQVNRERGQAGLPALAWDARLAKLAAGHAMDMAARNYFSHTTKGGGLLGRGGQTFAERVPVRTLGFSRVAENIAMLPVSPQVRTITTQTTDGRRTTRREAAARTYADLAGECVRMWMQSPGHRANILDGALRWEGIGLGVAERENSAYVYVGQNFGG